MEEYMTDEQLIVLIRAYIALIENTWREISIVISDVKTKDYIALEFTRLIEHFRDSAKILEGD